MTEVSGTHTLGGDIEAGLAAERPRLVRLCARLCGDALAAEDLAQETLAEAWRLLANLRQPEGFSVWLNAIARNVCRRWGRERGRELARTTPHAATREDGAADDLDALPGTDGDLTIALERGELVALLDRALALLPADTRAALVGAYVQEQPRAELAAHLGLSEGSLRVRLHRGRLALRRVLAGELRDQADALGLPLPCGEPEDGWRQTRIWCPFCGRHPLEYRTTTERGSFAFRCVGRCFAEGIIAGWTLSPVAGISSPKPVLARHCLLLDRHYRDILAGEQGTCADCGAALQVYRYSPDQPLEPLPRAHGIVLACQNCGPHDNATAWHLALDTPEAQQFWRRHPRMRALPVGEVEAEGRPALVSGFETVDGQARLVVVSDRWTHRVLRVHGQESGR